MKKFFVLTLFLSSLLFAVASAPAAKQGQNDKVVDTNTTTIKK